MITGASGLLGRAVVQYLCDRREYEIVAVISGRKKVTFPQGVIVEKVNLLDAESEDTLMKKRQPDFMIHLAWSLEDESFLASDRNIRWLEASLRLLNLFCKYNGQRFLFAGSSSEYGTGFYGNSEEIKNIPYTLYGICKLSFEKIEEQFCQFNGMGYATARYFSIYGPGDDRPGRAIPTAIQTFLEEKPFFCSSPWNVWDYIYVEDAAEATIALLDSDYCGSINVASGQPISMKEVFSTIATTLERPELFQYNEEKRESKILTADCDKSISVLGNYQRTAFVEGIKKTIQWWRNKER